MKSMKYLPLIVVALIVFSFSLAVPLASAWEFDNIKGFQKTEGYGKITIKNAFGFGKTLAEYELLENTDQCLINCYAEGTAELFQEGRLFSDVRFKDKNGNFAHLKRSRILIEVNESYKINVNDYEKECSFNEINKTEVCQNVKIGFHEEVRYKVSWKEYNYEMLPEGIYLWRIEGTKNIKENIDWIGSSFGNDLTEWAWWNSFWIFKRPLTNLTGKIIRINITYNFNMNVDFSDVRFVNSSENEELDYWIEQKINSSSAIFRIKTHGETNISMYYGSSGASTTSSVTDVYGSNLMAFYSFDEPTDDSSLLTDVLGNYNLTVGVNNPIINNTNGIIGKGFWGDNDGWSGGDYFDEDGTNRSYALKIKTSSNDRQHLLTNYAGEGNGWYIVYEAPGQIGHNYPSVSFIAGHSPPGVWESLVFTLGTGTNYVYLNGVLNNSNSNALESQSGGTVFYLSGYGGTNYLSGSMDEVMIWERQISATEAEYYSNQTEPDYVLGVEENRVPPETFFWNSESFNSSSVETATEGFKVNLTSDGTQTVVANLSYNGTSYAATKTGNNLEMEFSYNFGSLPEISTSTATDISFHWEVYYGSQNINTTENNQTVEKIALGLCNATLTQPYINFTFEDEETATAMNATIDTSTWTYYLGDGTVNKTLLYSTTTENSSFPFCFTPTDKTIHKIVSLQYSETGYPQRRWENTVDLTNITTNQKLYLLASADGTYSVYQVQTLVGDRISGVEVTAERKFNNIWTKVEQGETDDAGGVTFWLNPDFDHRLTFTKSGYTAVIVTVRPSSSTYTVVMADASTSDAQYNSSLEGLLWTISPDQGILQPNTNYTFGFNITANYSNMVSCKMELLDNNSESLGETTGCNQYGGNISIFLNTGNNRSIRGKFSVDMGDGYIVLDADAKWTLIGTDIPTRGTVWAFFKYARELEIWGDGVDSEGRKEYSRIIAFFFFLIIIMGVLSKSTGWDFSTDGGLIIFVAILVTVASMAGFFKLTWTGEYSPFIDKYAIAFITGLFAAGFGLNKLARSMT